MSHERLPEGALEEMLDAAPDGIVMAGDDGRIRYVNRAVEVLFGYAHDELIGVPVEQLIPGRLRGRHIADRAAYVEQPQPRPMGLGLRLQGLRRDGAEVPVEISLAPMTFDGDEAVVAVVRPATEQRRLEEERLRYAQAHAVEEIVGALDAIVWESTTPDRESLTFLGGREEMLLGYPREQWLQPGFWMSLVHPEDRLAALTFVEAARESSNFELLYRMISADGEVRQVRDIVTVTRDPDGAIQRLRGVITDITERQEIAARLTQAQKMEAVGQLAGGIAHDFNNLLTIVSGYARRLQARADMASAHSDLEQILLASDRAAELTRQLLAFARRGHTSASLIDVSGLARELEPMLRRLLAADIVFDFALGSGLPQVMMDRTGLEQIMMNLMINASDAMPSGGTLRVTARERSVPAEEAAVHGLEAGQYVELTVADTGTGMAPETVERIFEPFFSTKGERGTGMGLATVYGTVDQADGWIEVASTVGEGTTFTVLLPAAGEPAEAAPFPDPQRPTLLLVEDEPALRMLVVTTLEEAGYLVLQAGNGLDAIALAERHRGDIDLLLTDVVMPRLSGPELAQKLRALRPGLEVLFMSGYNDSRLVHRGVEEAKVNLVVKPFSPGELVQRVGELTGGQSPPAGA
ncbi:MAG TPA: PAS domain S-box protein [Solirubrobacteraceae bacterium]|nr:PAS domain S-box protein [Solirubrobacteraceae bacterium]